MKQTNKIDDILREKEFYNPGVTRYLKLGDKEIEELKSSLFNIVLESLPPKFEESDNKDDRYYCYGHNHAIDDVRKNLEELFK